ncbi:hypothetical protein GCM10029964_097400 [Kibdelosporangium lantanae]
MRFDPIRDGDRLSERVLNGFRAPRATPMRAFRRGDDSRVALNLPRIAPDDIDVSVERDGVTVRATRRRARDEVAELIIDERPRHEFSGGEVVRRQAGAAPENVLRDWLDQALNSPEEAKT